MRKKLTAETLYKKSEATKIISGYNPRYRDWSHAHMSMKKIMGATESANPDKCTISLHPIGRHFEIEFL
jgi:hypothetical protein